MSLWSATLWPLSGQTHTHTKHTLLPAERPTADPGHGNTASCGLDLHPGEAPQMRCQLLLDSPLLL